MFDTHGYQRILVDTFDEMLEIRDTIQAPILMFENEDKTCAKFIIPTDSKLLYLYEIKIEGYNEPEPEHEPDPTPTTIVKPNITNVVRPVVKVVVNQPAKNPADESDADISTVLEDAEVEVIADDGDLPDVYATVEESEESSVDADEASDEADELTADDCGKRYELKSRFGRIFYYTDVYNIQIFGGIIYEGVSESKMKNYKPKRFDIHIQKYDEGIYQRICDEINRKMPKIYKWWEKMSK
jgi:hypothetical protein